MPCEQADRRERGGAPKEPRGRPAAQTAALQRLGIDVWVRRQPQPRSGADHGSPQPSPAAGPAVRPQPAAERTLPRPKPATATAAPVTPFRIHCFHFGNVFAAIAEDAWPQRRLLRDVALAMNGFDPAERHGIVFEWPLPSAPPDGAERAFRAFFGHQTRNAPRTLIAGNRVAQLLGCPAPAACALLKGHLYIPPKPLDVAVKKALWGLICESDASESGLR